MKSLKRAFQGVSMNAKTLLDLIQKIMRTRAFEALGFPNVHAWMTARFGESLASACSAVHSVRALERVPEEKLKRIGERNAHMLTYLHAKERKTGPWIEKAAKLPTKEFKREVETALEKKTGLPQETFKTWSIARPEKVNEKMCAAEKKLAGSLGIDIETKPGLRIQVWEAWTQWILLQTDEQMIKVQTEGM
jgi:hypothetical protein